MRKEKKVNKSNRQATISKTETVAFSMPILGGDFMFCPYAVNRHTVQQTVYEYNEDGTTKMHQTIDHNTAEFLECKQGECGAWNDGKCCYDHAKK